MKNFAVFGAGLIGSSLMVFGPVKPDQQYGFLLLRRTWMSSDLVFEIDWNQKTSPALAAKDALNKALAHAECFA